MNRFQSFILSIISLVLMTCSISCQKSPINGDLDGNWQVMSVTPEPTEEIIGHRLYMGINLHTCQLTYYGGAFTAGNMVYDKDKKLLSLDFPYAQTPISKAKLKQYGINRNPVTFSIEHLDKKSLILRDGETVVTLRKF